MFAIGDRVVVKEHEGVIVSIRETGITPGEAPERYAVRIDDTTLWGYRADELKKIVVNAQERNAR